VLPLPHGEPHELVFVEQWLLSLSGFTHWPLQSTWPLGQSS
jgi:hypothetical protein